MKIIIEIATDNAAFTDHKYGKLGEISRILRRITQRIENGELSGKCMDFNGNSVGTWDVQEEE